MAALVLGKGKGDPFVALEVGCKSQECEEATQEPLVESAKAVANSGTVDTEGNMEQRAAREDSQYVPLIHVGVVDDEAGSLKAPSLQT